MNLTALQSNGLKLILTIIQKSDGSPVQAPMIAEIEHLKVGYVGKILFKLRKAGLVKAVRGKNGGYELARGAEEITLHDVLKALEVKEYDAHICPNLRTGGVCSHSVDCSIRPVLKSIDDYIRKLTSGITLKDLAVEEDVMTRKLADVSNSTS